MYVIGFTLMVLGALPLGWLMLVAKARRAQRLDQYVMPAAQVLIDNLPKTGDAAGVAVRTGEIIKSDPERYVGLPQRWPIDPSDLESFVTVRFPVSPGSNEKLKDRLIDELAKRLGFDGVPSVEWVFSGHGAIARLYPTPSFGDARTVYDYLDAIRALDESPHCVLLGLDLAGEPVVYDHVTLGPHIKASAGSGGGKSNLYRFLVPQYIRSGAQVVVLDVKGVSMLDLAVALEFKNIKYYSEAETCHNAFQAVFAELERRRREDIRARLEGRSIKFTPLHVVMEEANTLMAMLKDFWEYAKQAQEDAAKHSPAVRSMHYSVYMGREFSIYIHVIAQRAEAAVFGGGAVRENFNAALMSKWDARTWKMLAHGHKYVPHPMDWSWYLVTSMGVTRYMPPHLQESDAKLIADIDNVRDIEWSAELESVPDVRITSTDGYGMPQLEGGNEFGTPAKISGLPNIELAVTVSLREAHALMSAHGHVVPFSVLEQWQKGSRSATSKGYGEWPEPCGNNGRAKVYKRTDIIEWFSGVKPNGRFWDGRTCEIEADHCVLRRHTVYGVRVKGVSGVVAYVGQTHQGLNNRIDQHREAQYWGDEIIDGVELFSGVMTCIEARQIEARLTELLAPVLSRPIPQFMGPEGGMAGPKWNPVAVPVDDLKRARHARDRAAGKPLYVRERVSW